MNNEAHESVGGQDTTAKNIQLSPIIKAISSIEPYIINNDTDLNKYLNDFLICQGPSFMEIKIKLGSRSDLGRPTIKPIENKKHFMNFIKNKQFFEKL